MEEWRERGTGGMEGKNSSTNEHTHIHIPLVETQH